MNPESNEMGSCLIGSRKCSWLKVFPQRILIYKGTINDYRLEKLDIALTG